MSPDPSVHVPPSDELLGEAARRVGDGLSRAVRPPAHRRRVPAVPPAGDPRRRHGPRARPAGDRRRARGRAGRPVPRHLPGRGEAQLAARDPPRRARAPTSRSLHGQGRVRAEDALDGRQLRPPRPLRGRASRASTWGGVIVDEAHYIKNGSRARGAGLRLLGVAGATARPAGRLPAHRHADDQPAARPVQPAQGGAPPAGRSFYSYAKRYCAAFDNGYGLDTRGASNVEELATIVSGVMLRRTKSEALDLPPKTRTWLPVEVDGQAVPAAGGARARLLRGATRRERADLGARSSAAQRRPGTRLAVAKVAAHARGRPRPRRRRARRSSCSRRTPADRDAEGGARRRGRRASRATTTQKQRAQAEAAFQTDDASASSSATSTPPASASPSPPARTSSSTTSTGCPATTGRPRTASTASARLEAGLRHLPRRREHARRLRRRAARAEGPHDRRARGRGRRPRDAARPGRRVGAPRRDAARARPASRAGQRRASASSATSSTCSRSRGRGLGAPSPRSA